MLVLGTSREPGLAFWLEVGQARGSDSHLAFEDTHTEALSEEVSDLFYHSTAWHMGWGWVFDHTVKLLERGRTVAQLGPVFGEGFRSHLVDR